MVKIALIICSLCISLSTFCQQGNPNYDAQLAEALEADAYGMKFFTFVLLKTGPNEDVSDSLRTAYFNGHMQNIARLVEEEKLIVAGPFGRNDRDYRGIFILTVQDLEEARMLLDTDPAIANGLLEAEITPWYGSAALPTYLEASDKIWKERP